jgi:hypothetical protein
MKKIENLTWRITENADFGYVLLGKKDLQKESFPHFFPDSVFVVKNVYTVLWSGHTALDSSSLLQLALLVL